MKKTYILMLTILSYGITLAQPTLTNANFVPGIGESQLYYIADSNSVLDNTTGANVIFNYSGLRGYGLTQTQYFIDPTTTPNSGDYPTATFTDTTAGFPGNLKYNQDFTDSLNTIGLILDINTFGTVVAKYDDDSEIFMKFPFSYGDSFSDSYGGAFTSAAAPIPTNGNGTVSVTADAWGTLKLPMTPDIDSVLRVVRVENLLTDTIFLQPLFPDILPIPVNATQISYYKPSISKNPLISFVTADVNGSISVNIVSQYQLYAVGITEEDKNNIISIFPNPTNGNFTTLSISLNNSAIVNVEIFNNLSQHIEDVFKGELQQGKNQLKVKTSNLSKGLYFVNISVDGEVITKKLIIQ